jgi:predicted nucleotidyltransferase
MTTKTIIDGKTIDLAARLLLEAAPAGSAVILFGSYARGGARPESDLDFLVVEPEARNQVDEMVRLTNALSGLSISVDVLVVSAERFEYWKDTPNTVFYRTAREGRVYEQVA